MFFPKPKFSNLTSSLHHKSLTLQSHNETQEYDSKKPTLNFLVPLFEYSSTSFGIIFASFGSRLEYTFDIFTLPTWDPPSLPNKVTITDGQQPLPFLPLLSLFQPIHHPNPTFTKISSWSILEEEDSLGRFQIPLLGLNLKSTQN